MIRVSERITPQATALVTRLVDDLAARLYEMAYSHSAGPEREVLVVAHGAAVEVAAEVREVLTPRLPGEDTRRKIRLSGNRGHL